MTVFSVQSSSSASINKAAAATDSSGSNEHSTSLSDRLLDSCLSIRGEHNAILGNNNSGSIVSEYCKKNVLDIIPLEVQVVNAYLDQKMATLRSVIAAGKAHSHTLEYVVLTIITMYWSIHAYARIKLDYFHI